MSRSTLTFFLLIVSFGILFAGCSAPVNPGYDEFTFTDSDLQEIHELAGMASSNGSGTQVLGNPEEVSVGSSSMSSSSTTVLTEDAGSIVIDTTKASFYASMRAGSVDNGENLYRVSNAFVNVRASMSTGGAQVGRLVQGDVVTVLDIPNATWAKVRMADKTEGYVSLRYIAKLTTDAKLATEKKKFEGQYYVDFQFLNIRKEPSTQSEKVGELPGAAIVKPLSMNGEWARVTADGKEGYVSTQYLKPFLPAFLVRQEDYTLPILQYSADDTASIAALSKHVEALKAAGKKIVTLKSLYDTVLAQESRDARIQPGTVALIVTGVNAKNVKAVTDALDATSVSATLFVQTKDIGISGITEKMILNMMANGYELQSGGHTGDDLRSMTDSQVLLELQQSKKLLGDITKREVYAVAYPKGGVNDRVMQKAGELAYLFGIGLSPEKKFTRSQFLRLPSYLINSGMNAEDVVRLTN